MPLKIPASEWLQTHAIDRGATFCEMRVSKLLLFYERSVLIYFLLSALLLRFISNSLYFLRIVFYLYSDIVL